MSRGFWTRVNDAAGTTDQPGDFTTSPEALRVLAEQGVDSWRAWVAVRSVERPTVQRPE